MKKIVDTKIAAVQLPVQPIESAAFDELLSAELMRSGKLGMRKALRLLRKVDLKKAAIASGAAVAAISLVNLTGKYRFYKSVVAGELKKQLAPVNKKLDELQAENLALREQLSAALGEDAVPPKKHR